MSFSRDDQIPSAWRESVARGFRTNNAAGFTEYLRWMRLPKPVKSSESEIDKANNQENNLTKVQILQMAAEKARGYQAHFQKYNERTKLIAGEENTFTVECSWRIRVGGETGPENILLPAFDAIGLPCIPASTLKGVARSQALWEVTQNILDQIKNPQGEITKLEKKRARLQAEKEVAKYFGSLETEEQHQAGKVIFLDAYPSYNKWGIQGRGLAVDMANNIWSWEGDAPKYSPNPNPFLSLNKPVFLIGLKPTNRCSQELFNQVKLWLEKGLQAGIGSQVNTGYGEMLIKDTEANTQPFFQVKFNLTGQLIHGAQKYKNVYEPFKKDRNGQLRLDRNGKLRLDTYSEPEVRPVAFKSMLRYWFRTFALGYLSAENVQNWEATLFGSIQPQTHGWVKFNLADVSNSRDREQDKNKPCHQSGTLKLSYSREILQSQQENVTDLFKNLTWLMFHLGGVGQGARRPLYSRKNRSDPQPPWYRGTNLRVTYSDTFWQLPETPQEFKICFQEKLRNFCTALATLTGSNINPNSPLNSSTLGQGEWREAIDKNCQIIVCSGDERFDKPHALAVLHSDELKTSKSKEEKTYDSQLCGNQGDRSPVWIANLDKYQVVTVFGTHNRKRQQFLSLLHQETEQQNYVRIFPQS